MPFQSSNFNPNHNLVARGFAVVSVSVSSLASAKAAGVGPFKGLYVITSTSFTITDMQGNTMPVDNAVKNATLYVEGYLSVISTATSQFALL